MVRPVKLRCVGQLPEAVCFKPSGIRANLLQAVSLAVDEIEAMRLKDLEGLEQEECAQRMRISRPTFHRILGSARRKLADALVNGKTIQIEGGNFGLPHSRFRCNDDGYEWDVPFEALASRASVSCPLCASVNVQPVSLPGLGRGRGYGRRLRRGRHNNT
jgi:uncharacterized protein